MQKDISYKYNKTRFAKHLVECIILSAMHTWQFLLRSYMCLWLIQSRTFAYHKQSKVKRFLKVQKHIDCSLEVCGGLVVPRCITQYGIYINLTMET